MGAEGAESIQDNEIDNMEQEAAEEEEDDSICKRMSSEEPESRGNQEGECSSRPPKRKRLVKLKDLNEKKNKKAKVPKEKENKKKNVEKKPKPPPKPRRAPTPRGRKRKAEDKPAPDDDEDGVVVMDEEEEALRDLDFPERLQELGDLVTVWPKAGDDAREAEWIYRMVFPAHSSDDKQAVIEQIMNVLEHLLVSKFEIPYIGGYCKDECKLLLDELEPADSDFAPKLNRLKTLWDVHFWHKKWVRLQSRKAKSLGLYEAYTGKTDEDTAIHKTLMEALDAADSEHAVDDLDAAFPFRLDTALTGGYKRPKRSNYSVYKKHPGIPRLAKCFGLDSIKFAESLENPEKKQEIVDPTSSPVDLATPFIGGTVQDANAVLAAARFMVATEIHMEPRIRRRFRKFFLERATITTRPTIPGETTRRTTGASIERYNPFKWFTEKPLDKFEDGAWMFVEEGEHEGALTISVNVPKAEIIQELESAYRSDGSGEFSDLWNEQRKLILEEALAALVQSMEKEVRVFLASKARRWIATRCEDRLWKIATTMPYYAQGEDVARVAACCGGIRVIPTSVAFLNETGVVMDVFKSGYLSFRSFNDEQKQRQEEALGKLFEFMEKYRPHVVVVEASSPSCRHLCELMKEVTSRITDGNIDVVYGNGEIAGVLQNTAAMLRAFPPPDRPDNTLKAIALARFIQNPLGSLSTMFTGAERLPFGVHSMQRFLLPEEASDMVERVMVTAASQVGVDVNLAAVCDWHFGALQFIPGLGPRMSSFVKKVIQGFKKLSSRNELLGLEIMKKKAFTNAAAFLRIRNSGLATETLNPLDDTRVHPDCYEIAEEMARDAYSKATPGVDAVDLERALERVRKDPEMLKNYDIDFSKFRSMLKGGKGVRALEDVKSGLIHGYVDVRTRFEAPTEEEVFFWLARESPEVVGRTMYVVVSSIVPKGALCALETGTIGLLPKDKVPDGTRMGSSIKCVVTGINFEFANLDLTIAEGDDGGATVVQSDEYLKPDDDYLPKLKEEARKKADSVNAKSALVRRQIVHASFKNMVKAEAVQFLQDKEMGHFVFHPSAKGPMFLSLLVKIRDDLHLHEEILELKKDPAQRLKLGRMLRVSGQTFNNLNEIVTGFVEPLVKKLKTMMEYKKFKGTTQEVEEVLKTEKEANPGQVPYYISLSVHEPGTFTLSYLTCVRLHQEKVSPTPKGYVFRDRIFESPEKVAAFFKKNMEMVPEPLAFFGGRGGRGGGRACHNCGSEEHMSRECPTKGGGGGGGNRACHNCGEEGHISRECPTRDSGGGGGGGNRACHNCGEEGHISRECPTRGAGGGGGGGARACHNCGEEGHMSRECPTRGAGGGGGGNRACHNCGEEGHISRECPTRGGGGGGRACFNCGEEGHISRECPTKGTGGGGRGRGCFKCGEGGHQARDCGSDSAPPPVSNVDWGDNDGTTAGDAGWGSSKAGDQVGDAGWGAGQDGDAGWGKPAAQDGDAGWGKLAGEDQGGENGWGKPAGQDGNTNQADGWGDAGGGNQGGGWGDAGGKQGGGWGDAGGSGAVVDGGGWKSDTRKGGGGGGDRTCRNCGKEGHFARECPTKKSRGGCYSCGEEGHISRECPSKGPGGGGGGRGRGCFKCGEDGHISRDCPTGGGGRGACFKCGQEGHISRECPGGNDGAAAVTVTDSEWDNSGAAGGDGGWGNATGGGNDGWGAAPDGKTAGDDDGWGTTAGDGTVRDPRKGKAPATDGEDGWGKGTTNGDGDAGWQEMPGPDGWGAGSGSGAGTDDGGWGGSGGAAVSDWVKASGGDGGRDTSKRGTCYSCGGVGHNSRDCPSKPPRGACYSCGEEGHNSRDCPTKPSRGSGCFSCGEEGHNSKDCPTKPSRGGGGACFSCGEHGHNSRECPKKTAGAGGGGACYSCGEDGHLSRDCPKKAEKVPTCYSCGEEGHVSKECPKKSLEPVRCFYCSGEGHTNRECPNKAAGLGRLCRFCRETGHMPRDCPSRPPVVKSGAAATPAAKDDPKEVPPSDADIVVVSVAEIEEQAAAAGDDTRQVNDGGDAAEIEEEAATAGDDTQQAAAGDDTQQVNDDGGDAIA